MPHVWAVPAMKQQPNALRRLVTSHRLKAAVEEAEGQSEEAEPPLQTRRRKEVSPIPPPSHCGQVFPVAATHPYSDSFFPVNKKCGKGSACQMNLMTFSGRHNVH